jgi:hypothetical protein
VIKTVFYSKQEVDDLRSYIGEDLRLALNAMADQNFGIARKLVERARIDLARIIVPIEMDWNTSVAEAFPNLMEESGRKEKGYSA